jgi:rfaE bifunctional protein kinase chain/domain
MTEKQLFEKFNDLNVLIVGDVMIDRYLSGQVDRISPEAPVPIVLQESRDNRLGGAANVALNISALGATPYMCSVIGKDENASIFLDLLPGNELPSTGIVQSESRMTTVKTRVMAGSQQLLRVDQEDTFDLNPQEEKTLLGLIKNILGEKDIHVIVFQDYNKGVLTKSLIESVIKLASAHNIPTAVDPKFKNFWTYKGVTMFKPNLREIRNQCSFAVETNLESLNRTATFINEKLGNKISLITLSEQGLFVSNGKESHIVPTRVRVIADVCGAGDSVISVVSLGLALNLELETIANLANLAGGQVCEHNGVVPIDKNQLLEEISLG